MVVEISRVENGEVIASGSFGSIVQVSPSERYILVSSDHRFTEEHIRPCSPQEKAALIKKEMDEGKRGVLIDGPMHGGKTMTLGNLAVLSLANKLSVTYIRPANGRAVASEPEVMSGLRNQIVQPVSREAFLYAIRSSRSDLTVIDEVNVAGFLDGDIEVGKFFDGVFEEAGVLLDGGAEKTRRVALGMLDKRFDGQHFDPFPQAERWAEERKVMVSRAHMQSTCICGEAGEFSNRVTLANSCNGSIVFAPVSFGDSVEGVNSTYLTLCGPCFVKANGL